MNFVCVAPFPDPEKKLVLRPTRLVVNGLLVLSTVFSLTQASAEDIGQKAAVPLVSLLAEAESNSPEIRSAAHVQRAAAARPAQTASLADTKLTFQQLSVGSPKPFAGYSNSDFAYVGVGAQQELPYPGKRALRGLVARDEAATYFDSAEMVRRGLVEQVKEAYFGLAAKSEMILLLRRDETLLRELEQATEDRYRVGLSSQGEVLQAQIRRTRLLGEMSGRRREIAEAEADLKQLLHRAQASPDLVAEPLTETALPNRLEDLLAAAEESEPSIGMQARNQQTAEARIALARKEFLPDFEVGYMYQNTDRKYRDYYMLTLSVNLPNRSRHRAELAEAVERRAQTVDDRDAQTQHVFASVSKEYAAAKNAAEQLKIARDGLEPQSNAMYQAALAAYQNNQGSFQAVLSALLDRQEIERAYQQNLLEHEIAIAKLEALTGAKLR